MFITCFFLSRSDHCLTIWGKVLSKDEIREKNQSCFMYLWFFELKQKLFFHPLPHQIGLTGKEPWDISSVWNAMKKEGKETTEEETFPIWESCPREGGATKPSSISSSSSSPSSSSPSSFLFQLCVSLPSLKNILCSTISPWLTLSLMRQHKKCSNIDLKITLGSCWQSSVLGDSSEGKGNI